MASASSPKRLGNLIEEIAKDPTMNEGVLEMHGRDAFRNPQTNTLVGISLVDRARNYMESKLDEFWSHDYSKGVGMQSAGHDEVIIGGGYHAAVYARVRHLLGYPKPLVLDAGPRVGGTFACSRGPAFWLNSRNRPGPLNSPGEGAALNAIPDAPIQPSMLSNAEYQRNNDMAYIIRMTLAMSAKVCAGVTATNVLINGAGSRRLTVLLADGRKVRASRVLVAVGLGKRARIAREPCERLVTFEEFMGMMDSHFPLRDMRRIAVVGTGDSGKCALEAIFGIGPAQHWSIPDLDMPDVVDWYGPNVPTECSSLLSSGRTRYRRLASVLPGGSRRGELNPVRPFAISAAVEPGYDCSYVNGRRYDLVVNCTELARQAPGLPGSILYKYTASEADILGVVVPNRDTYGIGPAYDIPFSTFETNAGYANISENKVAMWRLGRRTATLASILPGV